MLMFDAAKTGQPGYPSIKLAQQYEINLEFSTLDSHSLASDASAAHPRVLAFD